MEHGLPVGNEAREGVALVVLGALLVDGELHDRLDRVDDVAGVLEAGAEVARAGLLGEELDEVGRVRICEVEAVVVLLIRRRCMSVKEVE